MRSVPVSIPRAVMKMGRRCPRNMTGIGLASPPDRIDLAILTCEREGNPRLEHGGTRSVRYPHEIREIRLEHIVFGDNAGAHRFRLYFSSAHAQ